MKQAGLRPRWVGSRRGAAGVSLLEMLLVVALIALVSTLAATALTGGLEGSRLRASAKELASQLRYTRAHAIAKGEPQRFVIDPQTRQWRAANGRRGSLPASVEVDFTGARQAQPSVGEGGIVFFPDGASTGGRVQLRTKAAAWNIDVAWLTGEVKLSRAAPAVDAAQR